MAKKLNDYNWDRFCRPERFEEIKTFITEHLPGKSKVTSVPSKNYIRA